MSAKYPGWKVVQLNDLNDYDQKLWLDNRNEACPGVAAGHFLNQSTLSYAVSMTKNIGRKDYGLSQLVLLTPQGNTFGVRVVSPPEKDAHVQVVWTAPPGPTEDWEETKKLFVKSESFVMEALEVAAIQYWFVNGKLHHLITSN